MFCLSATNEKVIEIMKINKILKIKIIFAKLKFLFSKMILK